MSFIFDDSALIDSLARIMVKECDDVSSEEEARNAIIASGVMEHKSDSGHETDHPPYDATPQSDYNSPAHIVYKYLGAVYNIVDSSCRSLTTANDRFKELVCLANELTSLAQRRDYSSACKKGRRKFAHSYSGVLEKHIVNSLSSEKLRKELLDKLSSTFAMNFILYWDETLNSYKRPSYRINRTNYLIEQISYLGIIKSHLSKDAMATLSNYQHNLSERLQLDRK